MRITLTIILLIVTVFPAITTAQIDEEQLGGWYTWFYNRNIEDTPWATQMIVQQRNLEVSSDEQLRLVLGQASFRPENHPFRYGFGYYHIRRAEKGSSRDEHILFQQGIYTTLWGEKNFMTFRLRLEEHWPDQKDAFRSVRAYASINRPLNQVTLDQGAIYLSLYDEYFANLNKMDYTLNRVYAGLGYKMTDHTSWQIGLMRQNSRSANKNQVLFHLFHHY